MERLLLGMGCVFGSVLGSVLMLRDRGLEGLLS